VFDDTQTDIQTDIKTDRQTDRQTDINQLYSKLRWLQSAVELKT